MPHEMFNLVQFATVGWPETWGLLFGQIWHSIGLAEKDYRFFQTAIANAY